MWRNFRGTRNSESKRLGLKRADDQAVPAGNILGRKIDK
ncbi:MAG: 50S ribosomal protein L27 [Clostridia bacterium]|nr:50S ribosomal protein L27 [Clostridia bacterium]